MSSTALAHRAEPFADINTTPLIDVLLVLLVMILLSVPVATQSLTIDLPAAPLADPPPIRHDINRVSVTAQGTVTFNGRAVTLGQLGTLLGDVRKLSPEPELRFEPEPQATYDRAAKVLNVIKASGVTALGFVGLDAFAQFGKAPGAAPLRR